MKLSINSPTTRVANITYTLSTARTGIHHTRRTDTGILLARRPVCVGTPRTFYPTSTAQPRYDTTLCRTTHYKIDVVSLRAGLSHSRRTHTYLDGLLNTTPIDSLRRISSPRTANLNTLTALGSPYALHSLTAHTTATFNDSPHI